MKKLIQVSAIAILFVIAANAAVADQKSDQEKLIGAFLKHIENSDAISADQKSKIASQVKSLAADPHMKIESVTTGLGLMYPEYAKALEASADQDPVDAIKTLEPFLDSDDQFLAADVSFFVARNLMSEQEFEKAVPMFESLVESDHTLHAGNAQYFVGLAYAGTLQSKKATSAFSDFLRNNPEAPERMRVSAWRKIQEIQSIEPGKMTDVHQHMNYSQRRLEIENTDKDTQKEQDDIIKMLGKLIKEQEKKECSNCKGSKNCKNPSQSKSQGKSQGNSQGESSQGKGSKNANGVAKRRFGTGPASPWSQLRERMRDPANTAIKGKLPPRYRNVIEKYSDRINKDLDRKSDR